MKKGFTLVELLIVVAILGILAAVGIVSYNGFLGETKEQALRSQHNMIVKFIQGKLGECWLGKENIMTRTRAEVREQGTPTKFKRIIVESFGNVADNIIRVHTEDDVFMVFERPLKTRDAWRKLGASMTEKRKLLIEYYVRDYGNQITKDHNVIVNIKLLPNKQPSINEAKVKLAKHGASW